MAMIKRFVTLRRKPGMTTKVTGKMRSNSMIKKFIPCLSRAVLALGLTLQLVQGSSLFDSFPDDALQIVLSHKSHTKQDLDNLTLVCKHWNAVIADITTSIRIAPSHDCYGLARSNVNIDTLRLKFTNLTCLKFPNGMYDDYSYAVINKFTSIKELHLGDKCPEHLFCMINLSQLRGMNLEGSAIDASLLVQWAFLTDLDLGTSTAFSNNNRKLITQFTNLKTLHLGRIAKWWDPNYYMRNEDIVPLTNLKELYLDDSQNTVTPDILNHFTQLTVYGDKIGRVHYLRPLSQHWKPSSGELLYQQAEDTRELLIKPPSLSYFVLLDQAVKAGSKKAEKEMQRHIVNIDYQRVDSDTNEKKEWPAIEKILVRWIPHEDILFRKVWEIAIRNHPAPLSVEYFEGLEQAAQVGSVLAKKTLKKWARFMDSPVGSGTLMGGSQESDHAIRSLFKRFASKGDRLYQQALAVYLDTRANIETLDQAARAGSSLAKASLEYEARANMFDDLMLGKTAEDNKIIRSIFRYWVPPTEDELIYLKAKKHQGIELGCPKAYTYMERLDEAASKGSVPAKRLLERLSLYITRAPLYDSEVLGGNPWANKAMRAIIERWVPKD